MKDATKNQIKKDFSTMKSDFNNFILQRRLKDDLTTGDFFGIMGKICAEFFCEINKFDLQETHLDAQNFFYYVKNEIDMIIMSRKNAMV